MQIASLSLSLSLSYQACTLYIRFLRLLRFTADLSKEPTRNYILQSPPSNVHSFELRDTSHLPVLSSCLLQQVIYLNTLHLGKNLDITFLVNDRCLNRLVRHGVEHGAGDNNLCRSDGRRIFVRHLVYHDKERCQIKYASGNDSRRPQNGQ